MREAIPKRTPLATPCYNGAMNSIALEATRNVRDTLAIAMEHGDDRSAIVVADQSSELAGLLLAAYRENLPTAQVFIFDLGAVDELKAAFSRLKAGDLVVLIQSAVFRIPDFRIRVELYRRDIKVVEHSNLGRIGSNELPHYVSALSYDPAYYRGIGHALKARMDVAQSARIEGDGETLFFDSPLELAKLNIGHFSGLKNFGSQFPIGEVFSEAKDLERVHGRLKIYGFTDLTFRLNLPASPITLVVERGRIVGTENSTPAFDEVLGAIRTLEGEVWIRELGFGMNRAFSRERTVADVGAFERVCGVHLSLGAKHGVYKKPQFNYREVRYHVDSFVVTERVLLDDHVVFCDGEWLA